MARIKVNVTEELIARATQRDSRHCMIAEAIQADYQDFRNISVDLQTIRWTNKRGDRCIALTPEPAAAALVEFDQGRAVGPFTFPLETVQVTKSQRRVSAEERAANPDGPKTTTRGRGRKTLTVQADGTRPHVTGGRPIREGHLIGHAVTSAEAAARRDRVAARKEAKEREEQESGLFPAAVPDDASNVKRSQPRYRQFGRRILKP